MLVDDELELILFYRMSGISLNDFHISFDHNYHQPAENSAEIVVYL